ncbi:MAG: hypothetical protein IJ763_08530 [Lachnospiraceae bacterium]|nr:hypothetical protein [Lachnospiraceae bacterium]
MNLNNMKDEFPQMPEELRIRINSEVHNQLNKEDSTMKKSNIKQQSKHKFMFGKVAAGLTAAAAALAICISITQMNNKDDNDRTKDIDDTVIANETTYLTEQQPLAPNSFKMVAYEMNDNDGSLTPAYNEDEDSELISFEQSAGGGEAGFTGLIFKINGDNISHVKLNIDKNGFYTMTKQANLSGSQADELSGQTTDIYTESYNQYGDLENDNWNLEHMLAVGNSIDEDYNPDTYYGFYISEDTINQVAASDENDDIRAEWHKGIDTFDGASLDVIVTFTDGTTSSRTYKLSSGKLALAIDENDHILGTLPKFITSDGEPYLYGLLGEPIN